MLTLAWLLCQKEEGHVSCLMSQCLLFIFIFYFFVLGFSLSLELWLYKLTASLFHLSLTCSLCAFLSSSPSSSASASVTKSRLFLFTSLCPTSKGDLFWKDKEKTQQTHFLSLLSLHTFSFFYINVWFLLLLLFLLPLSPRKVDIPLCCGVLPLFSSSFCSCSS